MKIGDRFTLKSGVQLEIRLNLVQILTGEYSCEGCYFSRPDDSCGDAGNDEAPACGSPGCEEQFIFVEVT